MENIVQGQWNGVEKLVQGQWNGGENTMEKHTSTLEWNGRLKWNDVNFHDAENVGKYDPRGIH
ncbi:unnamed protein product [Arabis nemorensis]|uniref:Uncharacterized protein n=1 Tax=Arabis nemorensis TaxID=586526 RepID=A0A565AMU5_9BRAS|nr:unnamed protein product [Arabis nemorensis]